MCSGWFRIESMMADGGSFPVQISCTAIKSGNLKESEVNGYSTSQQNCKRKLSSVHEFQGETRAYFASSPRFLSIKFTSSAVCGPWRRWPFSISFSSSSNVYTKRVSLKNNGFIIHQFLSFEMQRFSTTHLPSAHESFSNLPISSTIASCDQVRYSATFQKGRQFHLPSIEFLFKKKQWRILYFQNFSNTSSCPKVTSPTCANRTISMSPRRMTAAFVLSPYSNPSMNPAPTPTMF